MHSVWFGEFMGTLVLVLLGNGVNAGVTLRKSYAADSGWMVIATGLGTGRALRRAGCAGLRQPRRESESRHHAGERSQSAADYSHMLSLWLAQLLGAMGGAALVALHYAPHWRLTPDPAAKLGIFCTNAAVQSPLANIFSEMIGTAVLVLVAGAIFSHGVSANGPAAGLGPWLVASLVWGIGLSLGGTTGYAINPARDLGPRLIHALLPIPGKGGSNWSYAPIPLIGDLLGGALAGLLLRYAHL